MGKQDDKKIFSKGWELNNGKIKREDKKIWFGCCGMDLKNIVKR